jgi:hypothetical protein
MNSRPLIIFLTLLFCALSLHARGNKEKETPVQRDIVQVTGVVRLVGSGLFPELVITGTASGGGSETHWYVANEERDKLFNMQHRTVTVQGEETVTEMRFANGLFAGLRRELKNIRIISAD